FGCRRPRRYSAAGPLRSVSMTPRLGGAHGEEQAPQRSVECSRFLTWRLLIRRSVVERVCAIARNVRWVVVSSVTHLAGGGGPQRILLNLARRRVRERREVDALGYLEPG